jgi:isoquinoline 1-oxidoreductase alpha subunit
MTLIQLQVNGAVLRAEADPQMPLLWFLRDVGRLKGVKFGCGAGLCGACTVHIDGAAARACQVPVGALSDQQVTTIEGLVARQPEHPLLRSWERHQVPQCGYCQTGQIMSAAALLDQDGPALSEADVVAAMAGNLCRCGTYLRIRRAVLDAAAALGRLAPAASP